MDAGNIGKAICYLRKQAGLTQNRLAHLLNVSDKAVSKWERGLSCPDISLLPKIAILLDTDIESLLYGHHFQYKGHWCGVLLLDECNGISPVTIVGHKPLIFYILSYFMLLGIKQILIKGKNSDDVRGVIDDGGKFGIKLIYNDSVKEFVGNRNVAIFGVYTFLYGLDLTRCFQRAMAEKEGSSILAIYSGGNNENSIYMDCTRKIIDDKKNNVLTESYQLAPFLFCKANNWKMVSGCETFSAMLLELKKRKLLYANIIGRGMLRFDLNNCNSIQDLSEFVRLIQKLQGAQIACLEEIAWRRGMISKEQLTSCANDRICVGDKELGNYLLSLVAR